MSLTSSIESGEHSKERGNSLQGMASGPVLLDCWAWGIHEVIGGDGEGEGEEEMRGEEASRGEYVCRLVKGREGFCGMIVQMNEAHLLYPTPHPCVPGPLLCPGGSAVR